MYSVEPIVQEVIQLLKSSLEVPVCIAGPKWQVWAMTDEGERGLWDRFFELCGEEEGEYGKAAEDCCVYVRPCFHEEELLCYILVPDCRGEVAAAYAEALLTARYSACLYSGVEVKNRKRDLLANQLAGASKSDSETESYFRYLNCSRDIPRCAVLCAPLPTGNREETFPDSSFVGALERWGRERQIFQPEDIYGPMSNRLLLFKAVSSPDYTVYCREVEETVETLSEYVLTLTGGKIRICACAGSAYGRADQLYRSYNEANYLHSNLEYFKRNKEGCLFIHHFIFEYLYSRMDSALQKNMIQDLRLMLDGSPAISETVIALASNDNSPIRCAQDLGIHRNTVLQRIQKMKDGMDLDPLYDTRDRAAMSIYALQKTKKIVWNAGIIVQPDSVLYQGLKHLAALLYQKSGGTFQLNLHTVSTSGDNFKLFSMLTAGSLDLAVGSTLALRLLADAKISVLQMPFLFSSEEEAEYVLQKAVLPELKDSLEKAGLLCFDIWSMGWRYLTSREAPLRVPGDLKGRRIRILASDNIKDYFSSLGAIPLQIYYNNIKEALASNIIECQENPYTNILYMEFYRYQNYVTEMNMFYSMEALCLSQSSWQELEEERQEMLSQAVSESGEWLKEKQRSLNQMARSELVQKGMTIITPTKEELSLWLETIDPLYRTIRHREFFSRLQRAKKQFHKRKE